MPPFPAAKPVSAVDRHVGGLIRVRRKVLNLSQDALARRAKVSFDALDAFERGSDRVPATTLCAIAEILDVPVSYFFEAFDEQADRAERLVRTVEALEAAPDEPSLVARFPSLRRDLRRRLLELVRILARAATGRED